MARLIYTLKKNCHQNTNIPSPAIQKTAERLTRLISGVGEEFL